MDQERREYQRLHLTSLLDGRFGDVAVRVIDVSATGAQIEHDDPISLNSQAILRFMWQDEEVSVQAEMVRSEDRYGGLKFTEDSAHLRLLIEQSALAVIRAQMANLEGERERNIIAGDETLTAASAGLRRSGYLVLTWDGTTWTRRRSLLPDQPEDGFAVSAGESEEQIETLCRTYESGDAEARSVIRLLAELSVARAE